MSSNSSDDEYSPSTSRELRTARKSGSKPASQTYVTRRQAARNADKLLKENSDQFMANFNPETSTREKRKLYRKIHPPSNVRRPPGALYDENGIHIQTGEDLCDCLNKDCPGCFFECPKCKSQKCGTECRVHRKYMVEQVEYYGYDHVIKNPLMKH